MSDSNEIQKLIRLKRYEQPKEGYFEDFLGEFQRRQRSELLQRSARSLFFERLGTYFADFGRPQWAAVGAAACVAIGAVALLSNGVGTSEPISDVVSANSPVQGTQDGIDLWGVSFEPKRILVATEGDDSVAREAAANARERSLRAEYNLTTLPAVSGAGIVPVGMQDASPEGTFPDKKAVSGPSYHDF